MKTKKIKRKYIGFAISAAIISAICFDLVTTYNLAVEEGTYRLESEFDAISSATVKVSIVPSDYSELAQPVSRNTDPSYTQVKDMVAKAIELQGGLSWIIDEGDKVMIKVNLVGGNSPSGQGENTDVRVVKALIQIINDFTGGNVELIVAEGTARTNDDPTKTGSVWDNSGYRALLTDNDLTGINFRFLNLNQSISDLVEIDLEKKGTSAPQGTKYHVHKEEVMADVYIAVPVLKIHNTGITNALKLQIGTAPGCYYGYNKESGTDNCPTGIIHDRGQRRWTTEAIVDLSTIADIDFVVVDALMCLETYKTYKGNNQVRMNTIVAGVDPVSIDHVCTRLFCLNPNDIAHITLAEKIGLGTNDPDKIEIVGASIENTKKLVKKNEEENGRFGQSNRKWILSPVYAGTDITKQYITDEANFVPNENNVKDWSQPVYFFDDRIDLYSYYKGQENIVTYAFTFFESPAEKQAELWLGRHEAMYVYINGELVYSGTSTRSYSDGDLGEKAETINIKPGQNSLLVKTLNTFGDYTFALNICDIQTSTNHSGNRVEGLKFYIDEHTSGEEPLGIENKAFENNNDLRLSNYPNPLITSTTINFKIPKTAKTTVEIFNINGKLVQTLINSYISAGLHEVNWSIENSSIPSGMYLCVLKSGIYSKSIKIKVQ